MKRGFIPLVIIAIIGLVSVLTAGGGYAVYKYNEVAKEKAIVETQLNEQKERELEQLRDKVEELEVGNDTATTTEEVVEVTESLKLVEEEAEPVPTPQASKSYVPPIALEESIQVDTGASAEAIDKYGMTSEDWNQELESIPKVKELINSNKEFITSTEKRLDDLDGFVEGTLDALASPGFLDDTGTKYAQNYVDSILELISGYQQEVMIVNSSNSILNKLISAVKSHNKDEMERLSEQYTAKQSELDVLIRNNINLIQKSDNYGEVYFDYVRRIRS